MDQMSTFCKAVSVPMNYYCHVFETIIGNLLFEKLHICAGIIGFNSHLAETFTDISKDLVFLILLYIRKCLNAHTLCANLGLNAHTLCAKQSYICIRAFINDDIV